MLERAVLRSPALQRFVLKRHERAFRRMLSELHPVRTIGIVGGGLFPRTALILSRLLPESTLVLIDQSESNLEIARSFLSGDGWERERPCLPVSLVSLGQAGGHRLSSPGFINQHFEPRIQCDYDLLVVPLAFEGDRRAIYEQPPASAVLVHDWIWRRGKSGTVISWLLLKRLNLVTR